MNTTSASDRAWSNLPVYIIYSIQGLTIGLGNLVIVLTICRYKALRDIKEYIVVLGLSLADTINMAGFFFGGISRMGLLITARHNHLETVWNCVTSMQNLFWLVGIPLASSMLAVVSVDRLLCVCYPLAYIGWSSSYARSFVGITFLLSLLLALYIVCTAYGSSVQIPATCVPSAIVGATSSKYFKLFYLNTSTVFGVISVVVYVFVALFYKRTNLITAPLDHPNQQYELKRQKKVTKTLAISALCTLVLYVIPKLVASVVYPKGYYSLAVAMWCISNLNPFMNVFLYPLRQKEMKQALGALFSCRHMPEDLKNWNPLSGPGSLHHRRSTVQHSRHLVPRSAVVGGEVNSTGRKIEVDSC